MGRMGHMGLMGPMGLMKLIGPISPISHSFRLPQRIEWAAQLQPGPVEQALGRFGAQRQCLGDLGVGTVLELVHFQGGALPASQLSHGTANDLG